MIWFTPRIFSKHQPNRNPIPQLIAGLSWSAEIPLECVIDRFVSDSSLEQRRFELLVPPKEKGRSEDANLLKRCYVFTRHRAAIELVLGWRSDVE